MAAFRKYWWLFLPPLIIPILAISIRFSISNKPFYTDGGGFKTDLIGERSSLSILSYYLAKEAIPNVIGVNYSVSQQSGPHKGASLYIIRYNRRDKTLTKSALVPPIKSLKEPPKLTVWENVTEEAIHSVSAPVRAMKFSREVEAYKGGNLKELAQHGAKLARIP